MPPLKRTMADQVTGELRQRLMAGHWQPGQMLPGRRALAKEFGVAVGTLERAVAVLLADGLLQADDGRGTTVSPQPAAAATPALGAPRPAGQHGTLRAAVGIIAELAPYRSAELFAGQWPAQILAGCEQGLAGESGLIQRFVNLAAADAPRLSLAQGVQQLLANRVDAVVVIGERDVAEVLALTEAAGVPLVCAACDPVAAALPQVYIDSAHGGALAVRHLHARGYAPLVFLQPFMAPWVTTRLAGAQAAAGGAALRVFPAALPACPPPPAPEQAALGAAASRALLAAGFTPGTGVIAPNDTVAVQFMAAASELGLQAGRDYGIVGFDDRKREHHLTSLRPPIEALGGEVARLVLRRLRGEPCPTRVALPHCLIARTSTQPWSRALHAAASQSPAP